MAKGPRMPSLMPAQHKFSQVPSVSMPRSVFNRSHGHKTTFDAGLLIPILIDDIVPGDTVHCKMHFVARLTTPIKPLMDNLYLESFFFFVPYRLIWTNFVKFMGEQSNPGDSISYTIPTVAVPFTPAVNSLFDYFGVVPQNVGVGIVQTPTKVTCLPFRAYYLIYNQWFRDQNLISSVVPQMGDGPDTISLTTPFKRGKRHDYFTSCLTSLQKGTAIKLPLTGNAPVSTTTDPAGIVSVLRSPEGTYNVLDSATATLGLSGTGGLSANVLYADLSAVTAATINDLRLAFQQQKFLERDMRGGTRYTELVRSHFGVVSPDARLQRTEYLGGGSTAVVIAPIVQNAPKGAQVAPNDSPLGNLSAIGVASSSDHGFVKSFTEHGFIIGLVNVRADLTYQQGVERFWFDQTRFDKYWPEFAQIGEQAVLNRELYFQGTTAQEPNDILVFGYQERYAHLRYKPSRISGLYRSMAAGTLDVWHLSEKFASIPTLAQTFIEDQTSSVLTRSLYVPSEPDFYFDSYFDYKHARPMPVYGVPGFIDHF